MVQLLRGRTAVICVGFTLLTALALRAGASRAAAEASPFIESRAAFLGHPVHPMLVAFPLALLATSLLFDMIYAIRREEFFHKASYYLILLGVIGGLVAAIPGVIDFAALPSGDVREAATVHWQLNVVVLGLFIANLVIRRSANTSRSALLGVVTTLSTIGIGVMLVAAWYGGHLVYEHRVGVHASEHVHHHE